MSLPQRVKKMKIRKSQLVVLQAIAELETYSAVGAANLSEIQEKIGLGKYATAMRVKRLIELGLVKRVATGFYKLTEEGYDVLDESEQFEMVEDEEK